ncbi:hypothetical protein G6O69_34750 [Pseudenhygromyxa sp. WMMC2535]|nr:hypothetical protein [Pseudenhygromyxa sp. WMMC2535]
MFGAFALASSLAACSDDGGGADEANCEGETTAGGSDESSTDESGSGESEVGETGTETDTGTVAPEHYEVAFDVVDLAPDDVEIAEDFYLGGYGLYTARGPAEGTHDGVYARTMAVGYGEDDGLIVTVVDTVGFGNQWTREIRAAAAAATGLSPEQLIVSATHTHSGPDFQGLWGGVPEVYRERVISAIAASMAAAWAARVPARLEVASTTADNRNRRGWEFTDETLVALQAFSLEDDSRLGLTTIFAAHPVILDDDNLLISRDFCGYTVDALEDELGAPALFINGVQGDVSPKVADGDYADDFERAEAYGGHVAERTLAILSEAEEVGVSFHRDYSDFTIPVENENFLFASQAGILDFDFETDADGVSVQTQTAYFRLGDNQVQLIAFPGESLTRNGLAVKEVMSAPHQAIMGLSGDALGYFVPSDEWMTGLNDSYEESVSMSMSAGDTARDVMIELIAADPWSG